MLKITVFTLLLLTFFLSLSLNAHAQKPVCCKWVNSKQKCRQLKGKSKCKKYTSKFQFSYGKCGEACQNTIAPPSGLAEVTSVLSAPVCHKNHKGGVCREYASTSKFCRKSKKYKSKPGTCASRIDKEEALQQIPPTEQQAEEIFAEMHKELEKYLKELEEGPVQEVFSNVEGEEGDDQDGDDEGLAMLDTFDDLPLEEDSDSKASLRSSALARHNFHRKKHGVSNLTWSKTIEKNAQKWADKCNFKHGSYKERKGYGENLGLGYRDVSDWIDGMYNEIQDYNYENPGFTMATGHFTQIIWKGTLQVGCALGKGCKDKLWVCQYDPAGNSGDYVNNVPPLLE